MSFKKIGNFEETRYNDTTHDVYDAGLKFGATLHRFTNEAGISLSAIYVGEKQRWWCKTEGDNEAVMIREWNNQR